MRNLSMTTPAQRGIITGGFVVLFFLSSFLCAAETETPEIRLVQYSFTLRNTTNTLLADAELWCHAPLRETQVYRLHDLQASEEFKWQQDSAGNRSLCFHFHDLPPFSSKIVTITANLQLFNNPPQGKDEDVTPYLEPEPFIESGHPEIITLARELQQADQQATAESVFQWVAANVHYSGYLKNTRGALYALEKKKGDCTEFAALFAALCRAAGIPARMMGGYVTSANAILHPGYYHNWAEFYVDGMWQIADPQRKVFLPSQEKYIAMRVIKASVIEDTTAFDRFRFTGKGLKVKMN